MLPERYEAKRKGMIRFLALRDEWIGNYEVEWKDSRSRTRCAVALSDNGEGSI